MKLHYSYLIATLPAALAAKNLRLTPPGKGGDSPGQSPDGPGNGGGVGGGKDGMKTYIVTFKDRKRSPRKRCQDLSGAQGGSTKKVYQKVLNGCAMSLPPGALAAMKKNPNVKSIEEDMAVFISQDQNYDPESWGLDRINQCTSVLDDQGTRQNAAGVKVYIVDTGIRGTHEDFTGSINANSGCHFSAVDGSGLTDGNGHGTHVASTTCGNTYGVAENCNLCGVKVLGADGSGTNAGVIEGVDFVASNCLDGERCVANMSLGGGASAALDDAVAEAVAAGVTFVVAAGNSNADACNYSPAREASAITVGSTTITDARSSFSNWGDCLDVFAPGSSIKAAWSTSNTATNTISGTSMASPHVAGIAAGILGQQGTMTPAQVLDEITNGSVDGIANDQSPGVPLATTSFCSASPTVSPAPTSAPCDPNLIVTIVADNYPSETSWSLVNDCTNEVVGTGLSQGAEFCSSGTKFTFNINDTYGDGICCGYGQGSYSVSMDGVERIAGGEFGSSETQTFGSCDAPPTPPPVVSTPPPSTLPPVTPTNPPVAPTPPPSTLPPVTPTNPPVAPTPPPSTAEPTPPPTAEPTPSPTAEPTPSPTAEPTPSPTAEPTPSPTAEPTPSPTAEPTPSPTAEPTPPPTNNCKMVEITVTDSSGKVHTLGPISIDENVEVESLSFNVNEESMTTACPGAES